MHLFFSLTLILITLIIGCRNNDELTLEKSIYSDPNIEIEARVDDLLSKMTLEEKIGQMVQAERNGIEEGDIKKYKLGSLLSGGGSVPKGNTPKAWVDMYNKFQAEALSTRLTIPLVYGVDAVHGHNNVKGATIFPHNIGLGATFDADLVERVAQITAKEVAATGLDWDFAPCVAVSRDERWGRAYESFGESPELQELLAGAYIRGLQGPNAEMGGKYVIATAKHFIGDGGTDWGTGDAGYIIDRGDLTIDEKSLRAIHLPGYIKAIEENVGTIMASFSSYQGKKMHAHKYLLTDLLKGELGFEGYIISDWEAMNEIAAPTYYDKIVKSVNAGVDMFMEPYRWKELIDVMKKAVDNGDVSIARVDDAVRRILRIKFKAGLFENPLADSEVLNEGSFGSKEHREIAREAVRKSLVLLKNKGNILPLTKDYKVYVSGSNADDIGNQSGGLTIEWQGRSGNITSGTTILDGIKEAIKGHGEVVDDISKADVAIAVIGERPYAEGKGDDGELSLGYQDLLTLQEIKESGKPVVVIMVSGRPLIISDYIDDWDAFVVAWLPGSEGQGVADLIFGDYNFTGKLPVSWPRSIDQLPININDKDYNPLFEYGYGLEMDLED
ncbi:beta-glucosidase [Orenia metallireducens]|uniref:beta-glucosidase n=1 Tax=Orenia metallireducens TaxID=1413210 RepID=A0A1C0A6W3_9FIRM|nr:glycoside hydrolase family 3 N-terminal domain-containing protein [Orenia metallireducens]OCL25990.1 beta-glucosidase [Orenia metallireducens]